LNENNRYELHCNDVIACISLILMVGWSPQENGKGPVQYPLFAHAVNMSLCTLLLCSLQWKLLVVVTYSTSVFACYRQVVALSSSFCTVSVQLGWGCRKNNEYGQHGVTWAPGGPSGPTTSRGVWRHAPTGKFVDFRCSEWLSGAI